MSLGAKRFSGFLRSAFVAALVVVCAHAADDDTIISPRSGASRAEAPASALGGSMHSMSLIVGLA
ncbi:MAG TPA: hypothetical protein VGE76_02460, partial [Opitutaceae bacterium]